MCPFRHQDHISHCKTTCGTNWSNRWTYREFTTIPFAKSAAHRGKSREWGRLKAKVEPLLTLGNSENPISHTLTPPPHTYPPQFAAVE